MDIPGAVGQATPHPDNFHPHGEEEPFLGDGCGLFSSLFLLPKVLRCIHVLRSLPENRMNLIRGINLVAAVIPACEHYCM